MLKYGFRTIRGSTGGVRVEASTRLASKAVVLAMSIDEVARMVQDVELRYQKR